jgi:beta-N-acetylhexosaminidase
MLPHDLERLRRVELPPFAAAGRAGVKMVMTGHLALPAIDRPQAPPATLSPAVLKGLLRGELGFEGVIVTDAMDMQAIGQGEALGQNAVRAVQAGADLLLVMAVPADQHCIYAALVDALSRDPAARREYAPSLGRIAALKEWLRDQPPAPDLDVVACAAHQAVAGEIARRSITLVRNEAGLLPLRLDASARVAAVVPRPADLTPADTSSYVAPTLAAALRELHPQVDEFVTSSAPSDGEIAALVERLRGYDLVVLGTLNAFSQPQQQALVNEMLRIGVPTVVVAMRLPYDLAAFPQAATYVCTYSVLEPSMRALARALFGKAAFEGRLPVSLSPAR